MITALLPVMLIAGCVSDYEIQRQLKRESIQRWTSDMKKPQWWKDNYELMSINAFRSFAKQSINDGYWNVRDGYIFWKHTQKDEIIELPLDRIGFFDNFWIYQKWETTDPILIFDNVNSEIKRCQTLIKPFPSEATPDKRIIGVGFHIKKQQSNWGNSYKVNDALQPPENNDYRSENPHRPNDQKCVTLLPHRKHKDGPYTSFSVQQVKKNEITITIGQENHNDYGSAPTPDWEYIKLILNHAIVAYGEDLGMRYAVGEQTEDRSTSSVNPDKVSTSGTGTGSGYDTVYGGIAFSGANTSLDTTTTTTKQGGSFDLTTTHRIRYQNTEPDQDNYIDLKFLKQNSDFAYKYRLER